MFPDCCDVSLADDCQVVTCIMCRDVPISISSQSAAVFMRFLKWVTMLRIAVPDNPNFTFQLNRGEGKMES